MTNLMGKGNLWSCKIIFLPYQCMVKRKRKTETNDEEWNTERFKSDESVNSNLTANGSSNTNTAKQSTGSQNNPNI